VADVVIAPDGIIAYAEINPDYIRRPEPITELRIRMPIRASTPRMATKGNPEKEQNSHVISRDGSGAVLISCQATFEPTASGSRLLATANDW
jgi:hypothetical protein